MGRLFTCRNVIILFVALFALLILSYICVFFSLAFQGLTL